MTLDGSVRLACGDDYLDITAKGDSVVVNASSWGAVEGLQAGFPKARLASVSSLLSDLGLAVDFQVRDRSVVRAGAGVQSGRLASALGLGNVDWNTLNVVRTKLGG